MDGRRYPRAQFHDYNGGEFFVTVCVHDGAHSFGEIHDGEMHLSPLGRYLQKCLSEVGTHLADIDVPLFTVMPNHFHAIIVVRRSAPRAMVNIGRLNSRARLTLCTGGNPAMTTHHNCRLATAVAGIKAAVTRYARANDILFRWHSRYHEHIIRGPRDGNNIADYIETNVLRWALDCYHDRE